MDGKTIGYWITTGLLSLGLLGGGVMDLLQPPDLAAAMEHLGYPLYFALILGVWKLLGVVALLAPGFGRVKEWAYAGVVFNMSGAAISHVAVGDGLGGVLPPLVLLGLAVGSYLLRPDSRRLA